MKQYLKGFDINGMPIPFKTDNSMIAIDVQGHSLHSKVPTAVYIIL